MIRGEGCDSINGPTVGLLMIFSVGLPEGGFSSLLVCSFKRQAWPGEEDVDFCRKGFEFRRLVRLVESISTSTQRA